MLLTVRIGRHVAGHIRGSRRVGGMAERAFELSADVRDVLHLLYGRLVALQGSLNVMHRLPLPLGELLEHLCILLLLLQHLLIQLRGLLRLLDQLLDKLLAMLDLLRCVRRIR